jgi:hypothetical protein
MIGGKESVRRRVRAGRVQSPYGPATMVNGRFVVVVRPAGVGQERSYSVLPEIGRWPTKSVRAARGDIVPSRNIHRRIVNGLTDRCCSHINELHGTQSAYIARNCHDAGTCIGRAANNCPDLITVMRPQKEDATQASNRQIRTIIEEERNRPN